MSTVIKSIEKLNQMLNHDLLSNDEPIFDMQQITAIEAEISSLFDKSINIIPSNNHLDVLVKKVLSGNDNFSRKEIRDLPFVLYDTRIDVVMMAKIIKLINFAKERYFKRLLYVYFLHYDRTKKSAFLAEVIKRIFENSNASKYKSITVQKIYKWRLHLFDNKCMNYMSELYMRTPNIEQVLDNIGIEQWSGNSNFIEESLKYFFVSVANIEVQSIVLEQIYQEFEKHETIITDIANYFIPTIDNNTTSLNKRDIKKKATDIFYNLLGDPRFGKKTHKWVAVSDDTRQIFVRWLAEDDLELFFKIIDETAVDSMWRYRKKFWEAYLPYISNTWLFLGKDARYDAENVYGSQKNHGKLKGGASTQSVFVFQIGEFVFSEWSHNGKLRVKKRTQAKSLFGKVQIEKNEINDDVWYDEWQHAWPAKYSWQSKVSNWIAKYCGIDKNYDDWRLQYDTMDRK